MDNLEQEKFEDVIDDLDNEDVEPETEESEEETADDSDLDSEIDGDDIDDSDEEDEDEGFEIDEALRNALDEDNLKRLENHLKGAAKVRRQNEQLKKSAEVLHSLDAAFSEPDTAKELLRRLVSAAMEQHGLSYGDIFEDLSFDEDDDLDWKGVAKKEIVDPAIRELRKEIELLKAERAQREQESQERAYLKKALPKTRSILGQRVPGLTVTDQMVLEAVRLSPELRTRPWDAVIKHNGDKIAKLGAKSKPAQGPRRMSPTGKSAGVAKPVWEMPLEDALRVFEE